jgi:hypothetical protein
MNELQESFSFNLISNYGKKINDEIRFEVLLHALTPKKSTSYYRQLGSNLHKIDERPLTIENSIEIAIDLVESIQLYNENIVSKDERRVSINFQDINFELNEKLGKLNCSFSYISLNNLFTEEIKL